MYESTKRAIENYRNRQKQKGIKKRSFFLTDKQNQILRVLETQVKKIENLDDLDALDVSEDGYTFKFIFKGEKIDDTKKNAIGYNKP